MNDRLQFGQRPENWLLALMVAFIAIGAVNIYSATSFSHDTYYLKRYALICVVCLGACWLVRKVFPKVYGSKSYERLLYGLMVVNVMLLFAVNVFGVEINGAKRWLTMAGVTFQPSELSKLVVIITLAYFIEQQLTRVGHFKLRSICSGLRAALGHLCISAAVVYSQPDMSTAVTIVGLAYLMLCYGGLGWLELLVLLGVGAAGIAFKLLSGGFRQDRLAAWLDPWAHRHDASYQAVQSQISIGSGGFWGRSWDLGSSKYGFLPENHTDFAFAVFCQDFGFFGALLFLLLLVVFACLMLHLLRQVKDRGLWLLGAGIFTFLLGQSLVNMAMVTGLTPVMGVPMMFLTYGGSALLTDMLSMGIFLALYDMAKAEEEALRETNGVRVLTPTRRQP